MVGLNRLELLTSRLSGVRSNQLSYRPMLCKKIYGGDEENRTPDPLLARQVLSQLSYAPICLSFYPITSLLLLAFGRRMFLYVSVRLVIAPRTVIKIPRNFFSNNCAFIFFRKNISVFSQN